MSTFRNPVGPQPSRVYWRRRAVVLIGLVAVIAIIVLIVAQPRGDAQNPRPVTSSATPTDRATPTATSTNPADAVECDPAKIELLPITDDDNYDPGELPVLSFSLKSSMIVPCSIPVGSDVQEFRITSGDDQIWVSTDCQTDQVAAVTVLMPGVPKQGPQPTGITWDRTRSSPDTCDTPGDEVTAGGASYHLSVKVGEATSAGTKQFLLN